MHKIGVVIIDDERSAREELKRALKQYAGFELLGEARDADEARALIAAKKPGLIFLDIQLPGHSGFDLLEQLPDTPEVIFVTAFDQYAVRAFDNNALDYLLKPVREERFAQAIAKIEQKWTAQVALRQSQTRQKQVFIRDGERCHFVKLDSIYLITSADNYTRVFFEDKHVYVKRSLNQWEIMLDADMFFRINRTQLVNVQYIREVQPLPKGRLSLVLLQGMVLEVSTRQTVKFKNSSRL